MPFATTDLCTDDDLTMWESKMPALAIKAGVYAGKRQLSRTFLAKQLLKRSCNGPRSFRA